jgi:hypothetical protein
MMSLFLSIFFACSDGTPPSGADPAPATSAHPAPPARPAFDDRDQGQQHPPLPADNPSWEWDAGGFVPDYGWYGEHGWDDVRMRVVGHLGVIAWTQAQGRAAGGDLGGAAAVLRRLDADLAALPEPTAGPARDLRARLRAAAVRDGALLEGLSAGTVPAPPADGLAAVRARYLQQALSPAPDPATLRAVQADLEPFLVARDDLDLDAFRDFRDRHRLRAALWDAWADSLDPLHPHAPWGYWEPGEIRREALAVGVAAGWLGGDDWGPRASASLQGTVPATGDGPAWAWPGQVAGALRLPSQRADFSAHSLGRLPTGDSLIDVGGSPGPRAIGTLERLGPDDAAHQARLTDAATALDASLAAEPAQVLARIRALTAELDALPHGSRYYNVKQARNDGVRQLARAGHPALALDLLGDHEPLHHQDWACPNREGILEALRGRLQLAASDPAADATLDRARARSLSFLDQVDAAEAAGPGRGLGARPPWMQGGPPRGPQRPRGAPSPAQRPSENTATSPH